MGSCEHGNEPLEGGPQQVGNFFSDKLNFS
jgi:hypothetical protein